uniref:Ground-like domain-containing protein n=1 Tax=Steinernema glaseri TaxID=37863 RepID=A0A1I7YKN3_9BILA
MKLFFLLTGLFSSLVPSDARPTAACNSVQLKEIIDKSIVRNNLAFSSAQIRRQLALENDSNFVVICDEKPVTFASPGAVFCQRSVADIFCTVVQLAGSQGEKSTLVLPRLSSEAIMPTRREKPMSLESTEVEHIADHGTPKKKGSEMTTEASPSDTLPLPTETPVTEATAESSSEPVTLKSEKVAEQQTTPKDEAETTTTEAETTTSSTSSTTSKESESTTESTLVQSNGDSFFEMMIANQEDARRSMMNTSPPPPLQDVEESSGSEPLVTEGLSKGDDPVSQSVIE